MDIILNRQWERVINYQPHIGDVQSPSRHICGYENLGLPQLEARQGFESPLLRHVAMKRNHGKFLVAKIVFYSCSLGLVEDKDQNPIII